MAIVVSVCQLLIFTNLDPEGFDILGMKPETAVRDCGSPGGEWWWH